MASQSDSLPPPLTPGQMASFHENRGPAVVGVAATFVVLCTIAVLLRFYARHARRMPLCLDDWLAVGSLVFLILYCVTCFLSVPYGLGRHAWAVDPNKIWRILQIALFNALIYFTSHWFIKMSILAFYKRLFTFRIKWFKFSVCAVGIYTTVWYISSFFAGLFQCYPPSYFWEKFNPDLTTTPVGYCGAANAPLVIATSALNTLGDILVFSMPIAMLSQLRLSRARKFSLIGIFATGAFAIAAGIVRLTRTLAATQLGADTTWIAADIYIWTAAEAGVALICACLPIIGPLFSFTKKGSMQETCHGSSPPNSKRDTNTPGGGKPSMWLRLTSAPQENDGHPGSVAWEDVELQLPSKQRILRTDRYTVETCPRENQSDHSHSFDTYAAPGSGPAPESLI